MKCFNSRKLGLTGRQEDEQAGKLARIDNWMQPRGGWYTMNINCEQTHWNRNRNLISRADKEQRKGTSIYSPKLIIECGVGWGSSRDRRADDQGKQV